GAQIDRLVGATAAVEDALAGLVVDASGAPPRLRHRAALTYVKRLYSPFLLREPLVQQSGGGPEGALMAVWLYDDPAAANTPLPTQRVGALILLDRLTALNPALAALAPVLQSFRTDVAADVGTLHVALAAPAGGGINGMSSSSGGGFPRHSRSPSQQNFNGGFASDAAPAALDALLPPAEQGVEE
ncbi:hypothetical protein Agub_g5119, partial [Astrephomene gubernaculifera]